MVPDAEPRFSDEDEEEDLDLGGMARLVHLFSQEAAEEQEAGSGSGPVPGSTSGPVKLWLLQLGGDRLASWVLLACLRATCGWGSV